MMAALALPSRALVIDDPMVCDVNGDGEVNIADLNYVLGCMTYGENSSDANGDGITNYIDYAWIYYTIMGEGTEVATEDQCDFNGDGVVNGEDFDIIFEAWKNHAYEARFDLDHDGDLGIVDLGMIAVLLADLEGIVKPNYYIVGNVPFGNWDPAAGVEMTANSDGTYSYTTDEIDGDVWFVFADGLSSDWDTFNNEYRIGPNGTDQDVELDTWIMTQRAQSGAYKVFGKPGGTYTFILDPKNMKFKVEGPQATVAPTIYIWPDEGETAYNVILDPNEASVIYYRVIGPDGIWSEWAEYSEQLRFTEAGVYCVEAYAVAEGKVPSVTVSETFEVLEEVVPEVTAAPTIVWDAVDGVLTVKALGNGTVVLNVGNETASGEGEAMITVEYNIYEGIEIGATAYAQEVDKLPSETVEATIVVDALPVPQPEVTDAPVITWTAVDGVLTVKATGNGTVVLNVGNETANGEGSATITVNYDIYEGIETAATAYAQEDGKLKSETVEETIVVEAIPVPQPEVTATPVINYDAETFTVTVEGEGEIHAYVDGQEVELPYTFEQGEEDVTYVITATAQEEGKLISETATKTIVVPAKVEEPVDDPHMVGYWIVMTDLAGEEHWYSMNADPNGDPNWSIMMTLHHQPWDINVPFYFMVNGVRYGAETDMQLPEMGDSEHTILNPVFVGENNWYVPAGYTYTWGLQFKNGEVWLLVAQGPMTGIEELVAGKEVAGVRYFNMAGQEMQEAAGICIAVTTYTDGTTSAMKVIK